MQLQQIRAQWLNLCNRLNIVSHDLDINKLGLMKELIKKETNELTEIVRFVTKYRSKQAGIEKLKALIAKSVTTIEQLQTKHSAAGLQHSGAYSGADRH